MRIENRSLEVPAAAVVLSGHYFGNIAGPDEVAAAIVDLQLSTGEGPSIDAYRSRRTALEPELT